MPANAYDARDRVASYDANMELLHPNRAKMVQVALDVLPNAADAPLAAIGLGTRTGYFAQQSSAAYDKRRREDEA